MKLAKTLARVCCDPEIVGLALLIVAIFMLDRN